MVSVAITTICDLVEHCRRRLDDVSPLDDLPETNLQLIQQAAEEADESDLLWTTAELRHYANEAIREVAIRTRCIRDNARNVAGFTSFELAPGENEVSIDHRILVVRKVFWNGIVLWPDSEQFLDEASSTWREDTTDCPRRFVLNRSARQLMLVGLPTTAGTVSFDVIRMPMKAIEQGIPEIPPKYLPHCLHWMCHLAYLKNDADTADANQAANYETLFTAAVGPSRTDHEVELAYHQQGRRRARLYYF
tara:strand:+ start:38767 stop:39513 length:747 start_codon:yes stop_codon:yes gene_type:complete